MNFYLNSGIFIILNVKSLALKSLYYGFNSLPSENQSTLVSVDLAAGYFSVRHENSVNSQAMLNMAPKRNLAIQHGLCPILGIQCLMCFLLTRPGKRVPSLFRRHRMTCQTRNWADIWANVHKGHRTSRSLTHFISNFLSLSLPRPAWFFYL